MNEQLSRRTVVIGAPSMLLLSACGGGEDAQQSIVSSKDEMVALSQSVDMASPSSEELTAAGASIDPDRFVKKIGNFLDFYNDSFKPRQATLAANILYTKYRTHGGTKWSLTQIKEDHYGCVDKEVIPTIVKGGLAYGDLEKYIFASIASDLQDPPASAGYTHKEWVKWITFFPSLDPSNINDIIQHRKHHVCEIDTFMRSHYGQYTIFKEKVVEAEKHHQRRLQTGDIADEVVPHYEGTGPDRKVVTNYLRLGNKRKPVNREDLFFIGTRLNTFFNPASRYYTNESIILVGKNSTKEIGKIKSESNIYHTTTSTNFTIGNDQHEGIEHYIRKDIEKNGPLENMTETESRNLMRMMSEQAMEVSGMVYEGYLIGQYAARCLAQGIVAGIRWGFAAAKPDAQAIERGFDLTQMMAHTINTAIDDPELRTHVLKNQALLKRSLGAVGLLVVGSTFLFWIARKKTNQVVNDKPGASTNQHTSDAMKGVRTWFPGAVVPASQIAALGFTGYAGGTAAEILDHLQRLPGNLFAFADVTSGVSDLVVTSEEGKYNTFEGVVTMMSAAARIVSGVYTWGATLSQLVGWTRINNFTGQHFYRPIDVATAASIVTSGAMFLNFCITLS